MRKINEKIIIFYDKNGVNHARFEYDLDFGDGRFVHEANYVKKNELNKAIQQLCNIYRIPLPELQRRGIVQYYDYRKVDKKVKESEEILKKQNGFLISDLVNTQSNDIPLIRKIEEKLSKNNYVGIKIGSIALALILGISSTSYAIQKSKSPEVKRDRAVRTATSMLKNESNISNYSIDEMLEIFTSPSYSDRLYALQFGKEFLNLLQYKNILSKDVVERFENLYSLSLSANQNEKADYFSYNFCLYGINLVMGGDKYSYNVAALPQILKTAEPLQKETYVHDIMVKENVSRRRVEYAAIKEEADVFETLPSIAKVIMLTQLEDVIRRTNFTPDSKDYPSWWVGLWTKESSYNHERLLREVSEMKDNAIQQLYNAYSNESSKKM